MTSRTPLDDVEFLARSPHRVAVLRTLRSGPWTRPDLHDETGVSQPTLGRILGSFQDRNWIERDGRQYVLTAFGELVAEEFDDLLETVETVQRLGDVVPLLPTEQLDFDVRLFGDSTVVTPATGDVFRHVRRFEEVLNDAEHVRIMSDTIAPDSLEDTRNRLLDARDGGLVVESVITDDAIAQALADPTLAGWVRDLVESDRAPVHRYEGSIPFTMAVADDVAVLVPTNDQGLPAALVETSQETIRAWVEDTFEEYRQRSSPLTVDDLTDRS